jgi:hypothetical protein
MTLSRDRAMRLGIAAIVLAVCAQLFNSFACYKMGLLQAIKFLWLPSVPLLPAMLMLFTANPLRAVPAALVVIPYYAFAYYVDCIRPPEGGGASVVYMQVILYGLPTAMAAAWLGGPLLSLVGLRVRAPQA